MATAIIPSGTGTQTQVITINNLVKKWNNMTQNQQANNYVKYKNKLINKLTQEQKNKVIKYINNKLTQKQKNKVNFKPFTGVGRRLINVNPTISKTDLLMMAKFISFNKMTRLEMKNAGNYEMAFYDYLVNFFVQIAKAANRSITREQLDYLVNFFVQIAKANPSITREQLDYLVNFFVQTTKANPSITREQLDYLGNFFVQTAKANPSITREQLQGSLKNEMRKITRTKITRTNNRHRVPAIMRTGTQPNNRYPFLSATMITGGVPIRVA